MQLLLKFLILHNIFFIVQLFKGQGHQVKNILLLFDCLSPRSKKVIDVATKEATEEYKVGCLKVKAFFM